MEVHGCRGPDIDEPRKNVGPYSAYDSCRARPAVELYAISYFGHRRPLADAMPASEKIWTFFAAHPKEGPTLKVANL
jgi:poly(3-hydroxybutyrate) depolymerase